MAQQNRFAVFQVPAAESGTSEPVAYAEGTAAECALVLVPAMGPAEALRVAVTALERLPLEVLSGVEFEQALRGVKRSVGVREAAERAKDLVRGKSVHHAATEPMAPGESTLSKLTNPHQ